MYQSDRLSRNSYSSEMYKPQSKHSECRRCHSSSFEIFEPASRPNSSVSGISHHPYSNSSDEEEDERRTIGTNDEQLGTEVADFPREIVRMPTPPPIVKRIVERVPTPEAYVIERVIVRPAPRRIVERIIERPRTPPPRVVHKEITEPPPPPIVRTRVVKVDSWSKNAVDYYYEQPSYPVMHESISHSYSRSGSPYSNYDTYNACPVGIKCEPMNKKFPCYMHNHQLMPMQTATSAQHQQMPVHPNNGYFEHGNHVHPSMVPNYPHNIMNHNQPNNYTQQHPAFQGNHHNMSSVAYYQGNHVNGMPMMDYQHTVPSYDINAVSATGDPMYVQNPAVSWQGQQTVPYVYGYQHVPGGDLYHMSQQVY